VRGISCALESTLKKEKPAIPIGTLLALANSIFSPTHPEEGSRGRGRRGPATGTPAFFFSFPRAPSLKSDLPSNPVGIYCALVGTVAKSIARYTGNE
jgi:hypothetical protein